MLKLSILDNRSTDCDRMTDYDDPRMICYFETILHMWMWNHNIKPWFREQLGYPVWFRARCRNFMWHLESHGWEEEGHVTLFKLNFEQALGWKVVEMDNLEAAVAAHDRVIIQPTLESWKLLFAALGRFDMAPGDPKAIEVKPVDLWSLRRAQPMTVMVSVLHSLIAKGKEPPAEAIGDSLQARFVWGFMEKLRDPA